MHYTLNEINIPIVEHCNLYCKACLHFCHREMKKYYVDVEKLTMDLRRLNLFFPNINVIRLYGGEPLLHEELDEILYTCRNIFQETRIEILTNGLLLMIMSRHLIKAVLENQAVICWSIYPIVSESEYKNRIDFMQSYGILYEVKFINEFFKCFDFHGGIDKSYAFARCNGKGCHVLREGKLSVCPAPLVGHHINALGAKIDFSDGILDLYKKDVSSARILEFFSKPHNACAYCSSPEYFNWELQNEEVSLRDWVKLSALS